MSGRRFAGDLCIYLMSERIDFLTFFVRFFFRTGLASFLSQSDSDPEDFLGELDCCRSDAGFFFFLANDKNSYGGIEKYLSFNCAINANKMEDD